VGSRPQGSSVHASHRRGISIYRSLKESLYLGVVVCHRVPELITSNIILYLSPGYDIKLDPAVLPLLTSFGGLVAGRAFGSKKNLATNMTCGTPSACPYQSVSPEVCHACSYHYSVRE